MNNNLEFENEDPSPNSIEDNHPRTNYGEGYDVKETLEEAAERLYPIKLMYFPMKAVDLNEEPRNIFIEGAKWQAERMYSEEEVLELAKYITHNYRINAWENVKYGDSSERNVPTDEIVKEWFEQFKK
jgi:hypothetical protein